VLGSRKLFSWYDVSFGWCLHVRETVLCTGVREEGGDGEGPGSEQPSLLSYTLTYVSLSDLGRVCQFGFREQMNLCTYGGFIMNNKTKPKDIREGGGGQKIRPSPSDCVFIHDWTQGQSGTLITRTLQHQGSGVNSVQVQGIP